MVLFFCLCNYTYEQVAGLAAQPPCLKELATHRHACGEAYRRADVISLSIEKRHPICHELCDVTNRKGEAFSENATK